MEKSREEICLIVSGGEYSPFEIPDGAFVIGCDRGCAHLMRQGRVPDLYLGDFDSYRGGIPDGADVARHPVEKDDTDTMLAMRYAAENGFDRAVIACAFGGRLDHTLANLETMAYGAEAGLFVEAYGRDTAALCFGPGAGTVAIPRRDGYSLSVFAANGEAEGVFIRGTKYELENGTLSGSFPLGASNEWAADGARVTTRRGAALVIMSKTEEDR